MNVLYKRVLSLLMAMIMMFSCTTFAFASEPTEVNGSASIQSANAFGKKLGPYTGYSDASNHHYYVFTLEQAAYLTAIASTHAFMFVRIYKHDIRGEVVYEAGWDNTGGQTMQFVLDPYGAYPVQRFPAGDYMIDVSFNTNDLFYSFSLVANSIIHI